MALCLDCVVHPKKLCGVHALTDNLSDPHDTARELLIEASRALDSVGAKGHLPCAHLAGRIARFLAQNREPT